MSIPMDVPLAELELTVDGHARSRGRLLLVTSLVLLLAAAAALLIDVPVGQWCFDTFSAKAARLRGDHSWWVGSVSQLLRFAELFGHGWGVALTVCLIFVLDPGRRWAIPRLLAAASLSGLAVNLLKMTVIRTRPGSFHFDGSVWQTFGAWMPPWESNAALQSLPSGHTGLAVGLAIALIWIYPRGRYLFPVLALLVACQRIQAGAHWTSDVLSAAAVGCLVSWAVLEVGPLPPQFNRWEADWRDRAGSRRTGEPGASASG